MCERSYGTVIKMVDMVGENRLTNRFRHYRNVDMEKNDYSMLRRW